MEIEDLVYAENSPSGLARNKAVVYLRKNRGLEQKGEFVGGIGTHGYWQISISNKIKLAHRVIWEMFNGPITDLSLAIDHIDGDKLNNKIENLRLVSKSLNSRNRKRNKKSSGVLGVYKIAYYTAGEERWLWRADWKDIYGKSRTKTFTVNKYGEKGAYNLAVEYRQKMIEELNAQGAGYTERHTK